MTQQGEVILEASPRLSLAGMSLAKAVPLEELCRCLTMWLHAIVVVVPLAAGVITVLLVLTRLPVVRSLLWP